MPLDNTLNTSELLRRLGVKGDSQGSVSLLEALRLNLIIGDLSDLVPPVGVPFAGSALTGTSAVATFNKWTLHSNNVGGLTVRELRADAGGGFDVWITDTSPFGTALLSGVSEFGFGQNSQSLFFALTPAAKVAPPGSFRIQGIATAELGRNFDNWVGPSQFFNIEAVAPNLTQTMSISWKEYTAALNPG